jgi:hypothetical protein
MAIVQAYRRNKPYTHAFPDVTLVFTPNDKGDVVCDVQDQSAVDRLLLTPTGFRLYGEQPEQPMAAILTQQVATLPVAASVEVATLPVDHSPYVLKHESGEVFDLRPLTDEELRAFADANGIKVTAKAKGDTIRNVIVDFMNGEE